MFRTHLMLVSLCLSTVTGPAAQEPGFDFRDQRIEVLPHGALVRRQPDGADDPVPRPLPAVAGGQTWDGPLTLRRLAEVDDAWRELPRLDANRLGTHAGLKNLKVVVQPGLVFVSFDGSTAPMRQAPVPAGETVVDNQMTLDREAVLLVPFRTAGGLARQLVLVRPELIELFDSWLAPGGQRTAKGLLGLLELPPTAELSALAVFETGLPVLPVLETDLLIRSDEKGHVRVFAGESRAMVGLPFPIGIVMQGLSSEAALSAQLGDEDLVLFGEGDWRTVTVTPTRPGPVTVYLQLDRFGTVPIRFLVEPAVTMTLAPRTGNTVLLAPRTAFVLRARNRSAQAVSAPLQVWLPPEVRLTGLPGALRLAPGTEATFACELEVEADRPAGAITLRLVVGDERGQALGVLESVVHAALGRELVREGFEPAPRPGRVRRPSGALEPMPAAVGSGSKELSAATGPLVVPLPDPASLYAGAVASRFRHLTFWLLGDPAQVALVVGRGARTESVPLPAPATERRAPHWQRFVIDLAPLTRNPVSSLQLVVDGDSPVRVDDLAVRSDPAWSLSDRLRDLTERYAAGVNDAGAREIEHALAEIDVSTLDRSDFVDHRLLHHALLWRRIEPTLPPKIRGQPGGRTRFEAQLRHQHHLQMTPEDLLEFGHLQIAEHQRLLQELAERMAPGTPWREVALRLRDDHPSAEELPVLARTCMDQAMEFTVLHHLVNVPMAARNARVTPVTFGEMSRTYAYGGYGGIQRAPQGYVGTYIVSPPANWMDADEALLRLRGNHRAWTRIVALHEVVPGHHLQTVVHEMRPLSPFRRMFYSTTFAEGWALYCEELMWRAGYFTDDATRFTQLQMRLWRAVRVVVDVGLQCGTLSHEEAVRLFVDQAALDASSAAAEVRRDVDHGTRPLSYLLGFKMLTDMVEAARQEQGEDFREDRFLDQVLAFGPVPMATVAEALSRTAPVADGERPDSTGSGVR